MSENLDCLVIRCVLVENQSLDTTMSVAMRK